MKNCFKDWSQSIYSVFQMMKRFKVKVQILSHCREMAVRLAVEIGNLLAVPTVIVSFVTHVKDPIWIS